MHLNQDQQRLLFRIQEKSDVGAQFEVLCAEFEAALYETELPDDLEKTDPFGVAAIRSVDEKVTVETPDAAAVIAIAWLEMIMTAIMEHQGEDFRNLFDDDGVSIFTDTRPLFESARFCGFSHAHTRRAFVRVRGDGSAVPSRALKILVSAGQIPPLDAGSIRTLESNEIARALADSHYYTLVVEKGGYNVYRAQEIEVDKSRLRRADDPDVLRETVLAALEGFSSPFVPCDEAHRFAIDHFVAFLDEKGCAYEQIVSRALAA